MVDMAHIAGLVAAGLHPTPVGVADLVTTTTHKTLGGPRAGMVMSSEELATEVDRAVFPGLQGGPLMHVIAGKAVALGHALTPEFQARQEQTVANCRALAAEVLWPAASRLVSGGTDNHLLLVDLSATALTGADGEERLDRAGITVNKNGMPFDERPPTMTSGLRIGTPALTTRGPGRGRDARDRQVIVAALRDGRLRRRARGAARPLPRDGRALPPLPGPAGGLGGHVGRGDPRRGPWSRPDCPAKERPFSGGAGNGAGNSGVGRAGDVPIGQRALANWHGPARARAAAGRREQRLRGSLGVCANWPSARWPIGTGSDTASARRRPSLEADPASGRGGF